MATASVTTIICVRLLGEFGTHNLKRRPIEIVFVHLCRASTDVRVTRLNTRKQQLVAFTKERNDPTHALVCQKKFGVKK